MMGFKAFHSAQATIAGIETAHMIRKGQLSEEYIPAYKQFMALAGQLCLKTRRSSLSPILATEPRYIYFILKLKNTLSSCNIF